MARCLSDGNRCMIQPSQTFPNQKIGRELVIMEVEFQLTVAPCDGSRVRLCEAVVLLLLRLLNLLCLGTVVHAPLVLGIVCKVRSGFPFLLTLSAVLGVTLARVVVLVAIACRIHPRSRRRRRQRGWSCRGGQDCGDMMSATYPCVLVGGGSTVDKQLAWIANIFSAANVEELANLRHACVMVKVGYSQLLPT